MASQAEKPRRTEIYRTVYLIAMLTQVIITDLASALDRSEELARFNDAMWPEFLLHGDVRHWSSLFETFAEFQVLCMDQGILVGAGLTVPFAWHSGLPTPKTIDEVVYQARWPLHGGEGVLCALAALVKPEYRRRGVSREIIRAMRKLAVCKGLRGVLAPVRPTRKHEFPFESIDVYAARRDRTSFRPMASRPRRSRWASARRSSEGAYRSRDCG